MTTKPTPPAREVRALPLSELRVARADGEPIRVRGYAAVFGQLSEDLGGFREQIQAGAFSDRLSDDVRALVNHDPNQVLGRTAAKTLTLSEDLRGLAVEITLPDTQIARDLSVSMERGDVTQMSFAFTVGREDQAWQRDGAGPWVRTIKKVSRLYDVSVVTYPAYPQAEAALRSLEAWQAEQSAGAVPPLAAHVRRLRLRELDLMP
jgi:HK97 family phage prohead protease